MITRISKEVLKSLLEKYSFEGYYWLSNEDRPVNLKGHLDDFKKSLDPIVPFIVEANLFNEKEQISISLKHIEGKYIITRVDLKQPKENIQLSEEDSFKTIDGFNDIKVVNLWQAEEDELLEGMEVMTPLMTVFTGFKNSKKT